MYAVIEACGKQYKVEEKDEQGNQVIGTFKRGKALFGFVPSLELLIKAFD